MAVLRFVEDGMTVKRGFTAHGAPSLLPDSPKTPCHNLCATNGGFWRGQERMVFGTNRFKGLIEDTPKGPFSKAQTRPPDHPAISVEIDHFHKYDGTVLST